MKVFLTGATGYIGYNLALALAERNIEVVALARDLKSPKIPIHDNIIIQKGDICQSKTIEKAIIGCDFVFHTAAYTNLKCKSLDNFYNTNVVGTENVLRASLQAGVKKVIYTSTLSVFGPSFKHTEITEIQPRLNSYANDYEMTKAIAEEKVRHYNKMGLSALILNVSKVYGPGPSTFSNGVNRLINLFMSKDWILVPSKLDVTSNYVFIDDVISAHILAMNSDAMNGNFIIGGQNFSYKDLFRMIKSVSNSKIKICEINYKLVKKSLSVVNTFKRLFGNSSHITPRLLDTLFTNRISSSGKAIAFLKYKTTPFEVGLKKTIEHLKTN